MDLLMVMSIVIFGHEGCERFRDAVPLEERKAAALKLHNLCGVEGNTNKSIIGAYLSENAVEIMATA